MRWPERETDCVNKRAYIRNRQSAVDHAKQPTKITTLGPPSLSLSFAYCSIVCLMTFSSFKILPCKKNERKKMVRSEKVDVLLPLFLSLSWDFVNQNA